MKIAFLIPSTSNERDWKTIEDTYLYKYFLQSICKTIDLDFAQYVIYVGIDRGDTVYDNIDYKKEFNRWCQEFLPTTTIKFIYMNDVEKGHVTKMWNILFDVSYKEGCDYFVQCGDDVEFKTTGWINQCIRILKENNGLGVTGPIDVIWKTELLTQSMVSRRHMEIFGYYFPYEIINWFCDDWICEVYKRLGKYFPLEDFICENKGGKPRYTVCNLKNGINTSKQREYYLRPMIDKQIENNNKIQSIIQPKIIYINLDECEDRKDGMEKHLNLLGKKNYERFSAFRGEDITVKHNQKTERTQAEYGCLYSQIGALKVQENVDEG